MGRPVPKAVCPTRQLWVRYSDDEDPLLKYPYICNLCELKVEEDAVEVQGHELIDLVTADGSLSQEQFSFRYYAEDVGGFLRLRPETGVPVPEDGVFKVKVKERRQMPRGSQEASRGGSVAVILHPHAQQIQ